jgi:hypothetical protein
MVNFNTMYQKESKIPISLFVFSSIVYIVSKFLDIELIGLLVKPIIIPSIFFYYLNSKKGKINILFSLIFVLFFIGDMIIMLYTQEFMNLVLIPFMASYIILLKFIFEDFSLMIKNKYNFLYSILVFMLLCLILYYILELPVDKVINNHFLFLLYGLLLIVLVTVSSYIYLSSQNFNTLNLLLMSISMLISDLLYCIDKFIFSFFIIDSLNLLAQFASYYFMVVYFNSRLKYKTNLIYNNQ